MCPRIYSPFQPHHHQQQHLCERENDTQGAKGASGLGETWRSVGRLAFNGLHFVNGLSTRRGLGDSFLDSKELGVVQIQRANGEGDERRPEER